ncbi:lethal(3)malignant brain tumor-like protein 1 isoform X6 [Poecilia latipinna]|nr:PREDICTED: lethal(3)malignant brain tumor-like protein 1 isoform X5 [Poecilia latipinna]XP_014896814.1 PREDICTED: lethal(3)malignant brain tumor-like protein 1 isoform X5 [Poecilia latipinna]XP_014896815.1 PREDICTED: lethal(3)malignant brain tumor-like protein 1 isoform X5 [Poecilia latipinna]XP_014896816.1 PREDICTED: lethal(3)malignant brain tumor-like protein 1 isoform X6 [Poecilia latipinna]XP_014896817.1 PREDICTED: lethal(3)malignant brain tumor-like protein 1 isoform X6 [Poecilia latipi
MSGKVNMDAQSKEADGTTTDPSPSPAGETILICDNVTKKARAMPHATTTTALLLPAPPGHQKVELTQALAVANPGKGSRPNEIAAPTLTAQVGGACSIVHVLEWKEGMAILPSSNLKFCVSDVGTLSTLITPGATSGPTDPAAGTSGRSIEAESLPNKPAPEASVPVGTVRAAAAATVAAAAVEPERLVPVKLEAQVGPEQQNHDPRAQRSYAEELRRDPVSDKRSVSVEKVPAGGRVSSLNPDHLKPMRKRKRKEYLSPSEEDSDMEGTDEKMDYSKADGRLIRGGGDSKTEQWTWTQYLEETKSVAAPNKLFHEAQSVPTVKNGFKQGMKLEGIDPQHPSMYFVLTVAEVCGYRLRLHFDGYSDCHDFWVNANSPDIHPAGWCESTGHKLHTPKGCKEEEFTWTNYLRMTKAQVAPKELFASPGRMDVKCGFETGMKLEAVDRMNPSLICVATVTDVVDDRFLVHFDNWDDTYDYWCDASSPYIHPVGWCQERNLPLTPPQGDQHNITMFSAAPDYPDPGQFSWSRYLEETGSKAVAADAFKVRPPHSFQPQMKLEAVDKRSPGLIRVATVEEVETHRIKVHYDGWSHVYDEWMDSDHPDIHPAGWCEATGHPLKVPPRDAKSQQPHGVREPPAMGQNTYPTTVPCKPISHPRTNKYSFHNRKCPTPGCDGSGHVTGRFTAHHCISGCPLAERNQGRLKADLSDSECKRNLFIGQRTKKTHYRGRIGRPPKYRKNQQRDYQNMSSEGVYPSLFMSALTGQSDRTLSLCWEQHCKLLPGVQGIHASQVAAWSVDEVFRFVQNLIGCEEQARLFKEEMIDGEALLLLTQTDIVKIMSIKLGPALKISNAILMFKTTDEGLK